MKVKYFLLGIATAIVMPAMAVKGVQLIADSFKESVLLSIAHSVERTEA